MTCLQESVSQKMQFARFWKNMIVKIESLILQMILKQVVVQRFQSFEMRGLMIQLLMKFSRRQMSTHKVDKRLSGSKKVS